MRAAFRVTWRALRDAWDALPTMALLGLIWSFLSLTVVLLPPATAALFEAMHDLARGSLPGPRDYLGAVGRNLIRGWVWAVMTAAIIIVLVVSIVFYGGMFGAARALIQVPLSVVLVLWVMSAVFTLPYVFEQDQPHFGRAVRNAVLTALAAPVFTLTLAAIVAVIVTVSIATILPVILLAPALLALIANHAVLDRLRAFGKIEDPPPPLGEAA